MFGCNQKKVFYFSSFVCIYFMMVFINSTCKHACAYILTYIQSFHTSTIWKHIYLLTYIDTKNDSDYTYGRSLMYDTICFFIFIILNFFLYFCLLFFTFFCYLFKKLNVRIPASFSLYFCKYVFVCESVKNCTILFFF